MRSTDDYDFIVLADKAAIERVEAALVASGFSYIRRQDSGEASGPDFVQMANRERDLLVDLQAAKTDYQELVVRRARTTPRGIHVAAPEDIIVLKLIAFRGIDQRDLIPLLRRGGLDWGYIEEWAAFWEVTDRLALIRQARDSESGPA
jgi:hypothetical protein